MKKVFWKCDYSEIWEFTQGKEYEVKEGLIFDEGDDWYRADDDLNCTELAKFTRIEREVFEHGGVEWFAHNPGDPMPCDGNALVHLMFQDGTLSTQYRKESNIAGQLDWSAKVGNCNIIGWRYADKVVKPEPAFHDDDNGPDDDIAAMDWHAESEGEKSYREKQEAIAREEHKKKLEQDKRMEDYGKTLTKDFTSKFMLGMR